jgi:hypothetical protein
MEFSKAVDKIGVIFANMENDNIGSALDDLVFLGAKLHLDGHHEAGKRAILSALRAADAFSLDQEAATTLLDNLTGNEATCMRNIRAHNELLRLIPD